MKKILTALLLTLSLKAFSADLLCDISVNLDILSESTVATSLDQKILIDRVGTVTAYITEKENHHYVVEAFLADHEMRIYGEGTLREKSDRLVASSWSRDAIIDIECRLNSL